MPTLLTKTTSSYVQPTGSTPVTVSVASSLGRTVGEKLEVSHAGIYEISAIPSMTSLTITPRTFALNAPPGSTVSAGAEIYAAATSASVLFFVGDDIHALMNDIGGLLASDNFRLWLYVSESGSVAAGLNNIVPTIDVGVRQWDGASYLTPIVTAKLNGFGASGGVSVQGYDGFTDNTAVTTSWGSKDVIVFERRSGIYRASFGTYSGGFPAYSSLRTLIERPLTISGQNTSGAGWLESQARLYIDLRNNNSTPFDITLKRLLVQRLP